MSREDIVNLVKCKIENTVKLNLDYGVIAEYLVEAVFAEAKNILDCQTIEQCVSKIKRLAKDNVGTDVEVEVRFK